MDFSKHQQDRGGLWYLSPLSTIFQFYRRGNGVPGENHRSDKLYHIHNVVSSTPYHEWDDSKSQITQVVIYPTAI